MTNLVYNEFPQPLRTWQTSKGLNFSPDPASYGGYVALEDTRNWLFRAHRVQFKAFPMKTMPRLYKVDAFAEHGKPRSEADKEWGKTSTNALHGVTELYAIQHMLTWEQEARATQAFQEQGGVFEYQQELVEAVRSTLPKWEWSDFRLSKKQLKKLSPEDRKEALDNQPVYIEPREEEIEELLLPQILVTQKAFILGAMSDEGKVMLRDVLEAEIEANNRKRHNADIDAERRAAKKKKAESAEEKTEEKPQQEQSQAKKKPGKSKKKKEEKPLEKFIDEELEPIFLTGMVVTKTEGLLEDRPAADPDEDDDDGDIIIPENKEEKEALLKQAVKEIENAFGVELDILADDDVDKYEPVPLERDPEILFRALEGDAKDLLEAGVEELVNPMWFVATYDPVHYSLKTVKFTINKSPPTLGPFSNYEERHIWMLMKHNMEIPRWKITAQEWDGNIIDVTESYRLEETLQMMENLEENYILPHLRVDADHRNVRNMFDMDYRRWLPVAPELDAIHGNGTFAPVLYLAA